MKRFQDIFGSLFGNNRKESIVKGIPAIPYGKGSFIGQNYEVYDTLGKGGFGVVYLVYSHDNKFVYALKTFKDEYLENAQARERFRKEASIWADLEPHPYLVHVYLVDEVSGRLYIVMEYIAPDEQGLNSLEHYFRRRPPDIDQALRWAIQFCHGMEHAYKGGIKCHRDIKPANIMISQDKIVKISDLGLAGILSGSGEVSKPRLTIQGSSIGLSQTMEGAVFGTPTHMPKEQFEDAAGCDQRSDIYSFGIVLYQMAEKGRLPFLALLPMDNSEKEHRRFWKDMHKLHSESPIPKLNSPLSPIIEQCIKKEKGDRYDGFEKIREDLELLLKEMTGEVIIPPKRKEFEAWEWNNKGISLGRLGRFEEAIRCCDRAIALDPQYVNARINKGNSLDSLGRFEEAIKCCDKAINLYPKNTGAWNNKGDSLNSLGRFEEALKCCDKAIELDPQYAPAWNNKGNSLNSLGRFEEALKCCDKAIELDPQFAKSWYNKGNSLNSTGRFEEAITCYDKVIELDPQFAFAWCNKGASLYSLGRFKEAIIFYNKAITLNPQYSPVWINKALSEDELNRRRDALLSYKEFIALAPAQYATQIEYARQRIRDLERG